MGCGTSFEGVAVGADMYHQQNVQAFIGPYCSSGESEIYHFIEEFYSKMRF